jgi:hypothetical protein
MASYMNYMSSSSKVVAERSLTTSVEKLEMLRSYGFDCKHEYHAGFWLIHYQFPKLKLVAGHAVAKNSL